MDICLYHPTMVIFLDDSERYLSRIAIELDENLPYLTASAPQSVLAYIKNHSKYDKFTEIDYSNIYSFERFNQVSVLVVDYDMPGTGMDGFTFSQEIKKLSKELKIHTPKIILLTGQASEAVAIDGFNKGYIDRYISKNDPSYGKKLNGIIQELQILYFAESSENLLNKLASKAFFPLKDENFLEILLKISQENNIVERYTVNNSGDLLLLNKDGEPFWLIIISPDDIKYGNKQNYMKNANEIKNELGVYYYNLTKETDLIPIDRNKICSLKHYLHHVWPPNI